MPLHVEFILTDFCNLNCRGCAHYSPLAPKEFAPIAELEAAMEHLGLTCGCSIKEAYLIGGETLLYPQLTLAMHALRKAFPGQNLYIFTNGLLLPKMSDAFWATAKELGFILAITRYPINFNYDALLELCNEKEVKAEIFGDRAKPDSFYRFPLDPKRRANPFLAHFRCLNRGCLSVLGQNIYPCSISACIGHLNRAANTDFRHRPGDFISVRSIRSAADLERFRNHTVPFCSHCLKAQPRPFALSSRNPNEWISFD